MTAEEALGKIISEASQCEDSEHWDCFTDFVLEVIDEYQDNERHKQRVQLKKAIAIGGFKGIF